MVNWHVSEKHCHTMSGAVNHTEYMTSLKVEAGHTTCMLVEK